MNLYTKDGWLDIPHVAEVADRNDISFIAIIGKRQVGKTYGVLKFMLDTDKRFILMRGMKTELEMLERNVNSPFAKIKGYETAVEFAKDSPYTASISRYATNEDGEEVKNYIGMGAALSNIGRIRGFNGDMFSDLVYDEFIPESHLLKVRFAGDAFNNAYTTINGNRELEDRPPLRCWLLANSNNLDSEILETLGITKIVEKMSLAGEESRILKDRGIMILLPDSTKVIEKRKKGALYKAIGGDSKFARMAYGNEFAYNDYSDVANKPLKEYKAIIVVGDVVVHLHKNNKTLYVTEMYRVSMGKNLHTYEDTDFGLMTFKQDFPELRPAYMNGRISFQNMTVKNHFLHYIDLA